MSLALQDRNFYVEAQLEGDFVGIRDCAIDVDLRVEDGDGG